MRVPDIELLWWAGCPSTDRALSELHAALEALGMSGAVVRLTEISEDDEARERAFVGSPTILVDGEDVVPAQEEEIGLACRVYRLRDGRISPTPDPEDVREALRHAGAPKHREEVTE